MTGVCFVLPVYRFVASNTYAMGFGKDILINVHNGCLAHGDTISITTTEGNDGGVFAQGSNILVDEPFGAFAQGNQITTEGTYGVFAEGKYISIHGYNYAGYGSTFNGAFAQGYNISVSNVNSGVILQGNKIEDVDGYPPSRMNGSSAFNSFPQA